MATSNPGLSIHIHKENRAAGAVYRQIAAEIVCRIEDGALPRGSRLPTVRELSESLSITRVTAHKAYAELQASGWIESTVGRGTFVAAAAHRSAAVLADPTLHAVTVDGVMGAMHRFREIPDMASLAVAEPDPGLYPARAFLQLFQGLTDDAARLFEYGSPRGELDLRIELATLLAERGIAAGPEDILVTSGATQALTLVTTALCQPGDRVAVEQPTYLGVLGLLKSCGVEPVGVPLDDEGPRLDRLQRIFVRERPAFFYTIPTFQNPTGRTMSPERRSKLLWLAADHGVTIVEDDIYRPLAYSEPPPPPSPIKAQDCEHGVVYVDGFSKVLLPGVRVGYVVAPPRLRDRLVRLQQVREICGPPDPAADAGRVPASGSLQEAPGAGRPDLRCAARRHAGGAGRSDAGRRRVDHARWRLLRLGDLAGPSWAGGPLRSGAGARRGVHAGRGVPGPAGARPVSALVLRHVDGGSHSTGRLDARSAHRGAAANVAVWAPPSGRAQAGGLARRRRRVSARPPSGFPASRRLSDERQTSGSTSRSTRRCSRPSNSSSRSRTTGCGPAL